MLLRASRLARRFLFCSSTVPHHGRFTHARGKSTGMISRVQFLDPKLRFLWCIPMTKVGNTGEVGILMTWPMCKGKVSPLQAYVA